MVTLGQETINTPGYCQLDQGQCHFVTDYLTRYTLIGESSPGGKGVKILRLAAFAPPVPSSIDYSIRVYVIEDTPDALQVRTDFNTRILIFYHLRRISSKYSQKQLQIF
jgi:leucine-rich repeat transmembrane protein FLRT